MSKPSLLVTGSIAIDRLMNFSGRYSELIQPDRIDALSISVLLEKMELASGGTGANIAYNLAGLGEQPILLGSVGEDGREYMERLASHGVDTSALHYSQLPTATFNALTDADNNQVGGFYPGAMSDAEALSLKPWAGQPAIVCLSAHDPAAMRRQVQECQRHQLHLFYDPGQQVANVPGEDLAAGVDAAEVVIVNEYELGLLAEKTGRAAADLKASVPVFITTLGARGSEISGSSLDQLLTIAAARPDQILDPTGAGDAYRAGFLYGYLRQWNLKQCGQLGSVLASFVIEQHSTQGQLVLPAIAQRFQETFNEEIKL